MIQKNNPYLTNTRLGIDKNALLLMGILCLLSIGLMAFKLSKKEACSPFAVVSSSVIAGKGTTFYVSDKVIFHADAAGSDELTWDFGDESPIAAGNNVQHAYTRDAAYTVTATVNGKCEQAIQLVIKPLKKEETQALAENPINGPDNAVAGTLVSYTCTATAKQCSWSVLNSPIPAQIGQVANLSFPIEGTYIVELTLDADQSKVYRKQITVTPAKITAPVAIAPPPMVGPKSPAAKEDKKVDQQPVEKPEEKPAETAVPAKPKILFLADEGIKANFEAVVKGEIDAKSFNDFLCDGGATRVLVTSDDNRWETVESICKLFFRNKKIKKIEVTTVREGECVKTINLKYKKSWL